MRKFTAACVVFMTCLGGILLEPFLTVRADQWFMSYGKVPWAEEKSYLDNFAMSLKRNPEMIGYIAFYVGECDIESKIKKRVIRARNHVVNGRLKIDKERIVVVNAGKSEKTKFVLQPVSKTSPHPKF